jgi:N-acetylglucosamine kinase-like BadF-type ATPase
MSGPPLFAVDAGGSLTRVLVGGGAGTRELGSVNPHSAGAGADATLREVFGALRRQLPAGPAVGWLASAAVDPDRPDAELARVARCAAAAGLAAELVVSNDLLPLLWGSPGLDGSGVVLVAGTGSGFLGADRSGRVARAGGCEWLGSDEGGGSDIGQAGLRAAVRAADGRGPATGLVTALTAAAGVPPPELARRLAAEPFPKRGLADLAPPVCAGWLAGDEVAAGIVRAAVAELVRGVRAVRDRLALPAGFPVAAAGGVVAGCPPLYAQLADRLRAELGAGRVELVVDTAPAVLAALARVVAGSGRPRLPAGLLGRHAWVLPP